MQLKGWCCSKQVHVLIDSGASHNFIHPSALRNSKVYVQSIKPVRVKLAIGDVMESKAMASVELTLQGCSIQEKFYVLTISGCEVVLGAVWLKKLGDIL